jgi:hypothetical protein
MLPLQLSVAVEVPGAGTSARHWKLCVAGAAGATGAVLSTTLTTSVHGALEHPFNVVTRVSV